LYKAERELKALARLKKSITPKGRTYTEVVFTNKDIIHTVE
jgi:hypothetical protein